ncbi:MAG TPA: flagellar hook assembly protein FlgD [Bacilli bacterium]|nr:flagellar hook assembly protein FlgD [Bacilli bacterium]
MATTNTNTTTTRIDDSMMYKTNQTRTPTKELDRDAFLKILITQLQYQDPTQPMQDKEFIAQMAQFSSLEQMSKVAQANEQLFTINAMTLGAQMIGNTVTYYDADGNQQSGEVSSVKSVEGVVQLQIGDQWINMGDVESFSKSSS